METFVIECEVYGGITGRRSGMLKDADGQIIVYTDREEAETEAKRLREAVRYNTRASFSYTVVRGGR
jgi:hypothetical protein